MCRIFTGSYEGSKGGAGGRKRESGNVHSNLRFSIFLSISKWKLFYGPGLCIFIGFEVLQHHQLQLNVLHLAKDAQESRVAPFEKLVKKRGHTRKSSLDRNTENGTIKQFPFRNGKENGKPEIRMDIPRFPFSTSGTPL